MSQPDAFDWTDVRVAKHLIALGLVRPAIANVVRAVHRVDMVRAWYPETPCAFRWTSRACAGVVEFAYSAPGDEFLRTGRTLVCEECAARALRGRW